MVNAQEHTRFRHRLSGGPLPYKHWTIRCMQRCFILHARLHTYTLCISMEKEECIQVLRDTLIFSPALTKCSFFIQIQNGGRAKPLCCRFHPPYISPFYTPRAVHSWGERCWSNIASGCFNAHHTVALRRENLHFSAPHVFGAHPSKNTPILASSKE